MTNVVSSFLNYLFDYSYYSNQSNIEKNVNNIARALNISIKDASPDKCFDQVLTAFRRKRWELLKPIQYEIDGLVNSQGISVFHALTRDKEFDFSQELKTYQSVSKFLQQSEKWKNFFSKDEKPNFLLNHPENLVFQGGGSRGIAYVGCIRALEERGLIKSLKRVAGTSVGSITSALVAFGYTSSEMEKKLAKDFNSFFDTQGVVGDVLLNTSLSCVKRKKPFSILLSLLKNHGKDVARDPYKFWKELTTCDGVCSGEQLRLWIDELINNKTGIKSCTFGELALKVRTHPNSFKHLSVFATKIDEDFSLAHINSSNPHYKDIIISDAIRASTSIPGIFRPHILHAKDPYGNRVPRPDRGTYVDGGIIYNFPLEAFDKKKYQHINSSTPQEAEKYSFNNATLGFSLVSPKKQSQSISTPTTVSELLMATIQAIYNAESSLRNTIVSKNSHRTITVSDEGVGMLEFGMSQDKKRKLVNSGFKATNSFLGPNVSSPSLPLLDTNKSEKKSWDPFKTIYNLHRFVLNFLSALTFTRTCTSHMQISLTDAFSDNEKMKIALLHLEHFLLTQSDLFYDKTEIRKSSEYFLMKKWIYTILHQDYINKSNGSNNFFSFSWQSEISDLMLFDYGKWEGNNQTEYINPERNIEIYMIQSKTPSLKVWEIFYKFLLDRGLVEGNIEKTYPKYHYYYCNHYSDWVYIRYLRNSNVHLHAHKRNVTIIPNSFNNLFKFEDWMNWEEIRDLKQDSFLESCLSSSSNKTSLSAMMAKKNQCKLQIRKAITSGKIFKHITKGNFVPRPCYHCGLLWTKTYP